MFIIFSLCELSLVYQETEERTELRLSSLLLLKGESLSPSLLFSFH